MEDLKENINERVEILNVLKERYGKRFRWAKIYYDIGLPERFWFDRYSNENVGTIIKSVSRNQWCFVRASNMMECTRTLSSVARRLIVRTKYSKMKFIDMFELLARLRDKYKRYDVPNDLKKNDVIIISNVHYCQIYHEGHENFVAFLNWLWANPLNKNVVIGLKDVTNGDLYDEYGELTSFLTNMSITQIKMDNADKR